MYFTDIIKNIGTEVVKNKPIITSTNINLFLNEIDNRKVFQLNSFLAETKYNKILATARESFEFANCRDKFRSLEK